jgi:hypothetical protein
VILKVNRFCPGRQKDRRPSFPGKLQSGQAGVIASN